MRLITLLLILTLTGPSVGALVCDSVCAATYQTDVPAEGNCHGDPGPTQAATFAAGHECHDLPTLTACVVTCAPQVVDVTVAVGTAAHATVTAQASPSSRRADRSHAPPLAHTVPLRI